MRVLHVAAGNLYGGVETLLVTLARHRSLCPAMEPSFALCFEGRVADELREAGVPVHMLGGVRISRPWTVWRARRRFRRALLEEKPDVVICHSTWPHVVFAPVAKTHNVPTIFFAHDLYTGRHWLERWAKRTIPDRVLANSQVTARALRNLFHGATGEVVYLPVAAPYVGDRVLNRRRIRESVDTPEHAVVIILAARLEACKGHSVLLEALAQLANVPNWVTWIAGGAQRPHEQRYVEDLRDRTRRLGLSERVRFLGQRKDIAQLLAAADIACQPNTGPESFGIAYIEALYAGIPVVTTALGGALEIVNSTCGVLVPPNDAAALAAALRTLIKDPQLRARLGEGGPARASALCAPPAQLPAIAKTLDNARRVEGRRVVDQVQSCS